MTPPRGADIGCLFHDRERPAAFAQTRRYGGSGGSGAYHQRFSSAVHAGILAPATLDLKSRAGRTADSRPVRT